MFYTKYIETNDNQRQLKMKEFISEFTSIATVGAGYLFSSKNEKINEIWKDIKGDINFENLLFQVVRNNSLNGRTLLLPDYSDENGGKYLVDINENNTLNWINKARINDISAVISLDQFSIQNNSSYIIMMTFKLDKSGEKPKVIREVAYTQINGDKLPTAWVETDIPKDLRFEKYKEFDLDFLPVLEIWNKPFYGNATDYLELSDWFLASKQIDNLNRLIEIKMREAEKQQTRLYMFDQSSGDSEEIAEKNGLPTLFTKDMFIKIPNTNLQDMTKPWEIINGNFQANVYDETIQKSWNMIMRLSGHSGENDSTVQQTSGEIFYNQQSTQQTAKTKQTILNDKFNKLISVLFKLSGNEFDDDDWNFQIVENITNDKTQQATRLTMLVDAGLKTREEAIAEIDNITVGEAEEKAKQIEEKLEEERAQLMEEQQALAGDDENQENVNNSNNDE